MSPVSCVAGVGAGGCAGASVGTFDGVSACCEGDAGEEAGLAGASAVTLSICTRPDVAALDVLMGADDTLVSGIMGYNTWCAEGETTPGDVGNTSLCWLEIVVE